MDFRRGRDPQPGLCTSLPKLSMTRRGTKTYKMCSLRRKRAPGNLVLVPWFVLKAMRRNGIKRVVPSE